MPSQKRIEAQPEKVHSPAMEILLVGLLTLVPVWTSARLIMKILIISTGSGQELTSAPSHHPWSADKAPPGCRSPGAGQLDCPQHRY